MKIRFLDIKIYYIDSLSEFTIMYWYYFEYIEIYYIYTYKIWCYHQIHIGYGKQYCEEKIHVHGEDAYDSYVC